MAEETRRAICVDPWPVGPIDQYTKIESGPWGYLTSYSDGTFEFSADIQPSREEILSLWGSRLTDEE